MWKVRTPDGRGRAVPESDWSSLPLNVQKQMAAHGFEVTRLSGSFQLLLIWPSVPFCRLAWSHESNFVWGKPSKQVAIGNVLSGLLLKSAWKRMALRRCM